MATRGARFVIAGAIALLVAVVSLCSASGCYRDRLVPVTPRPCLTRPAPRPPADATPCSSRWAAYYRDLIVWTLAAEESCGVEVPEPDPVLEDVP